jgi:hypothetical protein
MPCCGRPANNAKKGGGEAAYHSRYAYRSSSQLARLNEIGASKCVPCSAITVGDPCTVCGNPKKQEIKEDTG